MFPMGMYNYDYNYGYGSPYMPNPYAFNSYAFNSYPFNSDLNNYSYSVPIEHNSPNTDIFLSHHKKDNTAEVLLAGTAVAVVGAILIGILLKKPRGLTQGAKDLGAGAHAPQGHTPNPASAAPAAPAHKPVPTPAAKPATPAAHITTQKSVNIYRQKARDEFIKRSEEGAEWYKQHNETRLYNIRMGYIQDVKSGKISDNDIYYQLYKDFYETLRTAQYPKDARFDWQIDELTGKSTSLIKASEENGWHYRTPEIRHQQGWSTSDKSIDRISVNAVTDRNLIETLDKLFGEGHIKGYYKTPDDAYRWLERHDPITIYLHEKATPEILSKIEQATKPYIRSTEDVLIGEKFAPGLALEKSPQLEDIDNLLKRAKSIDPLIEQQLKISLQGLKTNINASAGQITAGHKFLDFLTASS